MSVLKKILLFLVFVILFFSCATEKPAKPGIPIEEAAAEPVIKYVALTFDDGPSTTMTPKVLDRLEKYGIVASFFVVGQNINENTRPVLERAVAMGSEINNHSWDYSSMNKMSRDKIRDYIDRTSKAIEKYAGVSPKFFRPPNLAKSDDMFLEIELPFAEGILANDWAGMNTSAEDRAELILRNAKNGAIILMHDVQPAPHPTPEALDIIIPELQARGFIFLTVSGLFKQLGVDPNQEKAWKIVK